MSKTSEARPSWAPLCSSWSPVFLQGRSEGQIWGLGGTLGKAPVCPAQGTAFPSLLQLPSHLTHAFPCALALPLSPKIPSCSLPPLPAPPLPGRTGRKSRSWQPPESPAPHHRAEHVSLHYMKGGEPSCRCPLGCADSGRPARSCLHAGGSGSSCKAVPSLYWQ